MKREQLEKLLCVIEERYGTSYSSANLAQAIRALNNELEAMKMRCPKCRKEIKHLYNPKTGEGDGGECDCTKEKKT